MSSGAIAIPYCGLLVLAVTLARFAIGYTGAARDASPRGAAAVAPAVHFTIPLATLDEVRRLDRKPEIADVIHTARVYSDWPIFLAAYVTADDVRASRADDGDVADELVIEMGGYLTSQGVEADRISGKGMGIDPTIGRAVVVSFGITAPPSELDARVLQLVRTGLPGRTTLGMDIGAYGLDG